MRSTVGFDVAGADVAATASAGVASTSVLETTVFGLAAPRRRRTFIFGGGVDSAASAASAASVVGAADPLTKVNRLNTLPVSIIIGVRSGSTGPASASAVAGASHHKFCRLSVTVKWRSRASTLRSGLHRRRLACAARYRPLQAAKTQYCARR